MDKYICSINSIFCIEKVQSMVSYGSILVAVSFVSLSNYILWRRRKSNKKKGGILFLVIGLVPLLASFLFLGTVHEMYALGIVVFSLIFFAAGPDIFSCLFAQSSQDRSKYEKQCAIFAYKRASSFFYIVIAVTVLRLFYS